MWTGRVELELAVSRSLPGLWGTFAAYFFFGCSALHSQIADICTTEELSDPARFVYHCPNGLVFESEAAAVFDLVMSPEHDRVDAITLKSQAVLIELDAGNGPFQILTPYAIASVRGTVFVVDAQETMTSVFVVSGIVAVSRDGELAEPDLADGQGVTVAVGTELQVLTWPQDKVSALLARFAR